MDLTKMRLFRPSDDDIDIVLAALLKGLPGIDAEELDGLLKDLPMPEPGAKGGISEFCQGSG